MLTGMPLLSARLIPVLGEVSQKRSMRLRLQRKGVTRPDLKFASLSLCRCLVLAFVISHAGAAPCLCRLLDPSGIAAILSTTALQRPAILQRFVLDQCGLAGLVRRHADFRDFCTTNGTLVNCTTPATGSGNVVLSASPISPARSRARRRYGQARWPARIRPGQVRSRLARPAPAVR